MSGFTTDALLYPLTKGDYAGHPFHGNQWEAVGNISPKVADFLTRNANKFYATGGKVEELPVGSEKLPNGRSVKDEAERLTQMDKQVHQQIAASRNADEIRSLQRLSEGLNFTKEILTGKPRTWDNNHVLIATNKDGEIVGALNYHTFSNEVMVGLLGSTNNPSGIATALEVEASKAAAEKNLPITSTASNDAVGYHELMGRTLTHQYGSPADSSWSAEEVKAIAQLPIGENHA
jgi:hypothetical protein